MRLKGTHDELAWSEFCETYHPILERMARASGLREQEVPDAVQEIMIAIFRSIATYTPRQHPYAFRGWLAKIARHTAINYLNRKLRPAERNGTNRPDMQVLADGAIGLDERWEQERQRQLMELALIAVAKRVHPKTLAAFWRTVVDEEAVESVARDLEMNVGSIYVARGRIMAQLQQEVRKLEAMEQDQDPQQRS